MKFNILLSDIIIGSPASRNPLCPSFKNRPSRRNNQLWIESTRATIGKYEILFFSIDVSLSIDYYSVPCQFQILYGP